METLTQAVRAIEADLDELGATASARRRGEQLVTLAVGAHSAALERLIEIAPDSAVLEDDGHLAEVLWCHRPSPPTNELLGELTDRLDATCDAIEQTGVPGMAEAAARLLASVGEIYGSAISRALELIVEAGWHDTILAALDDELVEGALVALGLHPDDPETRLRAALDAMNINLGVTDLSAHLVGVDDEGTLRVRVDGEPQRDRWRVGAAIERVAAEVASDAVGVTIEGVENPDDDDPSGGSRPTEVFIPLGSVGLRRGPRPSHWVEIPELATVAPGKPIRVTHDGLALLACQVGGDLYVAVDPFSGDGLTLRVDDEGPPSVESPTGVRFTFDHPLPVQRDGDRIEVAVP